jgi:hypothetical protein
VASGPQQPDHDPEFEEVTYRLYTNRFVYSLRGIANTRLRETLIGIAESIPGMGEYMEITPYALHFGWLHQKQTFRDFVERTWSRLSAEQTRPRQVEARGAESASAE